MKKSLLVMVLLGIVLLSAASAGAADCICPKYPCFPYPGGNWFHYSLYHPQCNCMTNTPTGYIGPLSPPLSCPNCIALAVDSVPDLSYVQGLTGFDKALTPAEADIPDDKGVKAFLDKVKPVTDPEDWKPAKFTKSTRLQIRRKIAEGPDTYDYFTVALYKFHYKGNQQAGGIGIHEEGVYCFVCMSQYVFLVGR